MSTDPLYVIADYAEAAGKENVLLTAPLSADDRAYFLANVVGTMRPMTTGEYRNGPSAILNTAARFSYTLFEKQVFWCIEWEPGLIAIRFSPDGTFAFTALRSPNPHFGGREPLPKDLDVEPFDELDDNPQYNLVFNAWDPQMDSSNREWRGFEIAEEKAAISYSKALAPVIAITEELLKLWPEPNSHNGWNEHCYKNLAAMAGEGLRVRRTKTP